MEILPLNILKQFGLFIRESGHAKCVKDKSKDVVIQIYHTTFKNNNELLFKNNAEPSIEKNLTTK